MQISFLRGFLKNLFISTKQAQKRAPNRIRSLFLKPQPIPKHEISMWGCEKNFGNTKGSGYQLEKWMGLKRVLSIGAFLVKFPHSCGG